MKVRLSEGAAGAAVFAVGCAERRRGAGGASGDSNSAGRTGGKGALPGGSQARPASLQAHFSRTRLSYAPSSTATRPSLCGRRIPNLAGWRRHADRDSCASALGPRLSPKARGAPLFARTSGSSDAGRAGPLLAVRPCRPFLSSAGATDALNSDWQAKRSTRPLCQGARTYRRAQLFPDTRDAVVRLTSMRDVAQISQMRK